MTDAAAAAAAAAASAEAGEATTAEPDCNVSVELACGLGPGGVGSSVGGQRVLTCSALTLRKMPGSVPLQLLTEALAAQADASVVRLDLHELLGDDDAGGAADHVATVLRFYELGPSDGAGFAPGGQTGLRAVATKLRAVAFLLHLEGQQPKAEAEAEAEAGARAETAEADVEGLDRVLDKLMEHINENDGASASASASASVPLPGELPGALPDPAASRDPVAPPEACSGPPDQAESKGKEQGAAEEAAAAERSGASDVGHEAGAQAGAQGASPGISAEEVAAETLRREICSLERRIAGQARAANGDGDDDGDGSATTASPAATARATARATEKMKVELQRLQYEFDQTEHSQRHSGKKLAFNLLVVGVTGTGKSSSLNTLLDRQACLVSGGQAQGTRGCHLQDGVISDESFISFVDSQGLGADTSVTDAELLSQIMMSTESINRLKSISNILVSLDCQARATPATMANQLTLMELFGELRSSCFLILTKWNSPGTLSSWNQPLRAWMKRWRRARRIEDIDEDPPSYQTMYESYCDYIMAAMNNEEDAGAFSKMGTFLSFFQARVLWMYNLDPIQVEDLEANELDPHICRLYAFYRAQALQCLRRGATRVPVEHLSFLKEDGDTMARVASRLIRARDEKIHQLEAIGRDEGKRERMGSVFHDMAKQHCVKIAEADYLVQDSKSEVTHMDEIATLAGFSAQSTAVGCSVM